MSRIKNTPPDYSRNRLPDTPPKTPSGQSVRSASTADTSQHAPVTSRNATADASRADHRPLMPTPKASGPTRETKAADVSLFLAGCAKNRYPKADYISQVGMEVIHLLEEGGDTTRYLMGKTYEQGSYGKVRFAFNKQGELLAIKEMRLAPSRNPEAFSRLHRPKTRPMTRQKIQEEIHKTVEARGAIERHIQARIDANHGQDPLAKVRSSVAPFVVHEALEINNKIHLVTSVEAGDLWSVQQRIPLKDRGAVATSVAAQIFDELGALHAANIAHLDLKTDNILFLGSGQVKIVDFGLSEKTSKGVCQPHIRGLVGSIFPPEMYPKPSDAQDASVTLPRLTAAADVFVAGTVILNLIDRHAPVRSPLDEICNENGKIITGASAYMLATHEQWRQNAIDMYGRVRPEVLTQDHPCARYYNHFYKLAPKLVTILLAHVLIADPAKRAPAGWIAKEIQPLIDEMTPQQAMGAKQLFANAPGHANLQAKAERFAAYSTWDKQAHQGHFKRQPTFFR